MIRTPARPPWVAGFMHAIMNGSGAEAASASSTTSGAKLSTEAAEPSEVASLDWSAEDSLRQRGGSGGNG
eukprot:7635381-Pyramimonas_sp.AAC.1